MDLRLNKKLVLIAGGSKGIGLACAVAFAREGSRVVIASRDSQNISAAIDHLRSNGISADGIAVDLADPVATELMVNNIEMDFGPIDILVNCAGSAKRYDPEFLDATMFRAGIEAKYFPYVNTQTAVLRKMRERAEMNVPDGPRSQIGAIVNVIGTGGKVAGSTHIAGGAANAAIMLTTVGLANYYANMKIRINAINPSATLTGRLYQSIELEAKKNNISKDEALAQGQAKVPVGRYALPEEIADVATFLASERASYVIGAIVTMDGGSTPII